MNVVVFGATGMVGQGVFRECLLDAGVEGVTVVGRTATGVQHPKLRELVHANMWDYSGVESALAGFDACFFCLGVSVSSLGPEEYERVTYGITLAAAECLARLNPNMTFIYVSGAGTDSSEQGRVRWARVKGRTENALLRLPFRAAYMFRPGLIRPLHGIVSKTRAYRITYMFLRPVLPLMHMAFPRSIATTEEIGRAMLGVARRGASVRVLESKDIHAAARI